MINQQLAALFTVLGILAVIIIGRIMSANQLSDVLAEYPQPAWFILGFGCCFLLEGIVWGVIVLFKRWFPKEK